MANPNDIRITGAALWTLPVATRAPLKFGSETLTSVTCARVRIEVADRFGNSSFGWGETPLSVQWVWPSPLPYAQRHRALLEFTRGLVKAWTKYDNCGHPLELGHDFTESVLPRLSADFNAGVLWGAEPMPRLAALVCCSAFDLAVHDAYGNLLNRPTYSTYSADYLSRDLADLLKPAQDVRSVVSFKNRHPADYLAPTPPARLPAWHLVGGLDALTAEDLTGNEPDDGHPTLLADWIRRDGLRFLKVKLRGTDAAWDYSRMIKVAALALPLGVEQFSADFNCTVTDPGYVNDILDRLAGDAPALFARLRYIEQPFPYELEERCIDVHSVSQRKPLFLDESAHDWRVVRLGRELGWTGVALKTCKTQTGALLAGCWARAHGMELMVQDLTNPMLAMIPHALLAGHVGTIAGVETNATQFYPEASLPEAEIHPGLYQRRGGGIDLTTLRGSGFGYRQNEIRRTLPEPDTEN